MSVNAKEFIESGERLEKTAEIIDLDQKRVEKTLDKLGMTENEYADLANKLAEFSNETLARTLGVVTTPPNQPGRDDVPSAGAEIPFDDEVAGESDESKDQSDPIDNETEKPHNKDMSTVPVQAYLDKSIESIEKRMDDRIARIETTTKEIKDEYIATRTDLKKSKRELILWGGGIAVASILALWGVNSNLISNMQSSYNLGLTAKDNIRAEIALQNKTLSDTVTKLVSENDAKLTSFSRQNEATLRGINEVIRSLNQDKRPPSMTLPYPPKQ